MDESAVHIAVHAKPKGSRNAVLGAAKADNGLDEVVVQVTAAPEGGKANKAVCETVAKALGIAKGKVHVVRGEASRHKMLTADAPQPAVEAWLAALPRL